jgi:hypothetical protein
MTAKLRPSNWEVSLTAESRSSDWEGSVFIPEREKHIDLADPKFHIQLRSSLNGKADGA